MSSTLATWDKISGALSSTGSQFGGSWGNLISDYLNGVDIGIIDPTKLPRINTLTRFKYEKFGLLDGDESHHIIFSAADIDTGGTRKIVFRRMNSPNEVDYAVLENLTQTLAAKNLVLSNNTITDTSAAVGDMVKHDGTRYTRFAKGSGSQLLRVNTAGNNLEWIDHSTILPRNVALKSGDASNTIFTIPHGMSTTPTYASVIASSVDALGAFSTDVDSTNITITYTIAPPGGTNNLEYLWVAV